MLAGWNISLGEPNGWQIAAISIGIFANVSGDIRQLKGKTQIIGAQQGFLIMG